MANTIIGLEELQRKLDRLSDPARVLRRPMLESLETLKDYISAVPGGPKYPIQWTSAKQKRAFFATDGFGGGIPHRRTNSIARAWTTRIENGGTRGVLGNNRPGARFVHGQAEGYQQLFHRRTGWRSDVDVVKWGAPRVIERFRKAIDRELSR